MFKLHRPLVGAKAPHYVFMMLIAFGLSVAGTRVYLEATGYPQIGDDTFHFAHALWGGLLLFVAVLLLLIYVNRWMVDLSAVLAGAGVGLFIDEVGKFITQANDYFFPLAAPIIYVTFLLTLLVYLIVKRRPHISLRGNMYQVLSELEEVLEDDLSVSEHAALVARLQPITCQTERSDLAALAVHITEFLQSDAVKTVPDRPADLSRLLNALRQVEDRFFSQTRTRRILLAVYVVSAFSTLLLLFVLINVVTGTNGELTDMLESILLTQSYVSGPTSLKFYLLMTILSLLTDLLTFAGTVAFVLKRDSIAITMGTVALVITLTFTNTLSFYFGQFSILLSSIYSFGALLALLRYRDRFLQPDESIL